MTMPGYCAWANNGIDPAYAYSSANHAPKGIRKTEREENYKSDEGSWDENHFENLLALPI